MKIGNKEIKMNADTAIDISAMAASLGADFCVKKVIKEMMKHSLPEPVKTSQKVIFKIGEYAFTAAIGAVISDKISSIGEFAKNAVKTIKQIKEIKEEAEDGSSEPETKQQPVQED